MTAHNPRGRLWRDQMRCKQRHLATVIAALSLFVGTVIEADAQGHSHLGQGGQGQLDANAWAALAFLEGYRVARTEAYRQAAERVLDFAIADLFDTERGAFGAKSSPPLLDANGVMAEALLRAHRFARGTDYLTVARRVLAALGGTASALLVEHDDGAARVDDAAYYLRAYARVAGDAQGREQWR